MSGIYSTKTFSTLDELEDISINPSDLENDAILQYNDATNLWESSRPYFMRARLETTEEDREISPGVGRPSRTDYQLTNLIEQFSTGVFSYNYGDWDGDEWTCPQYGIYRISAQVAFLAGQNDRIDKARLQIRKLPTSGSDFDIGTNQLDLFQSPGTRDTADNITPFMTILHEVQFGEKIRLAVSWEVGGSPNGMDYLGSTTEDLTYITIERVI